MMPALFVGLGELGRTTVEQCVEQINGSFPRFLPGMGVVSVYTTKQAEISEANDLSGEPSDSSDSSTLPQSLKYLLLPVESETKSPSLEEMTTAIEAISDRLQEGLKKLTDNLLDVRNLTLMPDADSSIMQVFVVASLEERAGVALVPPIGQKIREVIEAAHPTLHLKIYGLWFVPEGDCELAVYICKLLSRMQQDQKEGTCPYDFIWLISPVNPRNQRLDEDELLNMGAEFLSLQTISNLPRWIWHPYKHFGEYSRMGSSSVTCIEFPAQHIIETGKTIFSKHLVENGLLQEERDSWDSDKTASEFTASNRITRETIRNELLNPQGKRSILEEAEVGDFEFSKLPESRWCGQLIAFDTFFRRERLPKLLSEVDKNAADLANRLTQILQRKVDELVENHRLPTRAKRFVVSLSRCLDELRKEYALQEATIRESPTADIPYIDALKDAISNKPNPWALGLKLGFICSLLLIPFGWFLSFLPRLLGSPTALLTTHPLNLLVSGFALAISSLAYGWLAYSSAYNRIQELLKKCISGIQKSYHAAINDRVNQRLGEILNRLFCLCADEETLKGEFPCYQGPNEQNTLEAFEKMLNSVPEKIGEPPPLPMRSLHLSVIEYADQAPIFPHKQGRFDLDEEARKFVEDGGYRGWRELTADELAQRLKDFAGRGFDYVKRIHLDEWMRSNIGRDNLTRLWQRISVLTEPFLCMDLTHLPDFVCQRLLLTHPEASADFCQWITDASITGADWDCDVSLPHHQRMLLCSLMDCVEAEKLVAWRVWTKEKQSKCCS